MLLPNTITDLADMIQNASGPLHIRGGGTRDIGRPMDGTTLSSADLNGITLYEPGALTLVAQSGTPVADIEAALDQENQRLAFEPMDHRVLLGTTGTPTIGGVVAANVSGPRRIAVGACRDFALGVTFVDGAGRILKNGGRVMKNVTGYDLVKLMAGSWGTLGMLCDVSLKVLPKPETSATLVLGGLDVAQAVAAMSRALGSPYEVTGCAHDTQAAQTCVRIEGFEQSVTYRASELTKLLAPFGDVEIQDVDWTTIRDVSVFADQPGDVWRISAKPSDAPDLISRMGATQTLLDWGGGLIWALAPQGGDLRAKLGAFDGHATLIRADVETRHSVAGFAPEPAPLRALTQGLRAQFDPRGILNPGLMD
ncbi:FAD-binding protein [Aestuariibius sp. HNIBRBA575]|uniref:FAD-binding protein n=1 Tax=Aestuariibius sp. HNIBRBA575 TaxID=3233343 RepID=UPI0034A2B112